MYQAVWSGLDNNSHHRNPVQILANLLNHFASAPKSDTHSWVDESISLQYLVSFYEKDGPDVLSSHISNALTETIKRIFGERPNIEVTYNELQNGYYTITINIEITVDGELVVLNKNIKINEESKHIVYDEELPNLLEQIS